MAFSGQEAAEAGVQGGHGNMETEFCWAVWNRRVGFYYPSVSDTRKCAIEDHIKAFGNCWRKCRKNGDRAVKIKIEICDWKYG